MAEKDIGHTPGLPEVLRRAIDARLIDAHVGIPARVESYDSITRRVSAQPLIRRGFFDEDDVRQAERLPVVTEVPVMFPGSGKARIKFPITKGDIVWLMFADASLDKWLELDRREVDPEDDRAHALTDAVAIPFPDPDDATPQVEFTSTEIRAGGTAKLATKADIDALESWASSHKHVETGGTTNSPTTSPPSASGTAVLKGS